MEFGQLVIFIFEYLLTFETANVLIDQTEEGIHLLMNRDFLPFRYARGFSQQHLHVHLYHKLAAEQMYGLRIASLC